jgi:hypothetical protein
MSDVQAMIFGPLRGRRPQVLVEREEEQEETTIADFQRLLLNPPQAAQQMQIQTDVDMDADGCRGGGWFVWLQTCLRELAFSFMLLFASGVAVSDPNGTSTMTTAQLLGVTLSLPQFVITVSSHGTVANTWLSIMVFLLRVVCRQSLQVELATLVGVASAQMGGGVLAMWLLHALRGPAAVCKYIPEASPDVSEWLVFLVEFLYCFPYGYLYLKLFWCPPGGMGPVVNSVYRSIAMTAYIYVGIVAVQPFSGFGANLVRNVAPSLVVREWGSGFVPSVAGQAVGYTFALAVYIANYTDRMLVR